MALNKFFISVMAGFVVVLVVFVSLSILNPPSETLSANTTKNVITDKIVTPTPISMPEYVMCSDYQKITDRYKTPNGYYIVVGNDTIPLTVGQYTNTTLGGYVKKNVNTDWATWREDSEGWYIDRNYVVIDSVKTIISVTEAESGYRMACKVVR